MGLKPGRTVRAVRKAWTRTAKRKVKSAYVRGVPDSKIRAFHMGGMNPKDAEMQYDLLAGMDCQTRDNAMESARVMANKVFEKRMLPNEYHLMVRVFPHQCLREHSMLSGAGADRLSSGMRKPFGRPVGRAIVTKKGQMIMSLYTFKKHDAAAKEGLYRAARKLPGGCTTRVTDLTKKAKKKAVKEAKK